MLHDLKELKQKMPTPILFDKRRGNMRQEIIKRLEQRLNGGMKVYVVAWFNDEMAQYFLQIYHMSTLS